jgi:hypothetical protein
MRLNWRFRLRRTFFGLSDQYMEDVYEQIFYLKNDGNWNFTEIYNLPVKLREWFVTRLTKHFNDRADAVKKARRDR